MRLAEEILVKNGIVVDPLNGVDCEVMDIAIKDGQIVDKVDESKAKVIDASEKLVMPGGVDLHSHIAGPKVNAGRLFRPEDHYADYETREGVRRAGVGRSVPSIFTTGYRYSEMGYTTVVEPATPPLKTLHTYDEFQDLPLLDKACFPLLGNNWFVMEYLKDRRMDECAAYAAWIMSNMKGYAIKIVNPGGIEAWKWGGNVDNIDDEVPRFNITPRDIVRGLCKVNRALGMPHPIHVHANGLGRTGNYKTTIKTMDCVSDLTEGDKPCIHMTHVQFNAYGGSDYASMASRADVIADYVNRHKHVTIDIGQVIFTDTTTMTADGPFEYHLFSNVVKNKWVNADVESETGSGVVPVAYRNNNYVHAVMWAIGLELALLVDDPWRVFLTTDHPNGGPFTEYARVISWLMSKPARDRVLKKVPRMARIRTHLKSIDREYSFHDVAITTRAATAKILGLKNKGHLGASADADVAIYDINPKKINPSSNFKDVRRAFRRAYATIKDGRVVWFNGEIVDSFSGRSFWVNPMIKEDLMNSMIAEVREKFAEYYTIRFENYMIPDNYLTRPTPIVPKSRI